MTQASTFRIYRPLLSELRWFVRLRWMAGATVLVGSLAQGRWLEWYPFSGVMAAVGAGILSYNLILWFLMARFYPADRVGREWKARVSPLSVLLSLAWSQLLADLACLTLLTLLTGGITSPLLGFFVFHMVFASLLLPRRMAYAGASLAMAMLSAGLWASGKWPTQRHESIAMLAWVVTLLMTVWVANGITRSLRRQRRRLFRRNRRIRAMSRTLSQQQQGMIQQEKMAVAGRMAAGVAHEIANPLAGMDGLLQLMERRPEKDRPDAVRSLREQVMRINRIVRRMTEFAHPGSGQWQTVALNDLVEKAMEVMRFDARIQRVQLDRQLGQAMPPVRVMADAVQQVILNLMINALDAMESVPSPRLVVRTEHTPGWCSLSIADNGHGIAEEHRNRIFEPFFTTKPVGKGTGLGLSISYSLVSEMGGDIAAENLPEQGARFTVRLPVADGTASHSREAIIDGISGSENE